MPVASTLGLVAPVHFDHPVANPWFPVTPGLVTRLRGTDEGRVFHEVVRSPTRPR